MDVARLPMPFGGRADKLCPRAGQEEREGKKARGRPVSSVNFVRMSRASGPRVLAADSS